MVIQALGARECVNLSEAMAKLIISGLLADQAEAVVMGVPVQVVPCGTPIAVKAAHIATVGKPIGLSLGDQICLATAQARGGTALTRSRSGGRFI